MTEIQQRTMSREDAERLTERARLVATTLMEARDKLASILSEAHEGRVWEALDMPNIQAWTEFAFSTTPLAQLSREDRRVIVKELAAEGYGTRAIAPVIGASRETVRRDLAASDTDVSDAPREVHGRDGITRTFQPRTEPTFDPTPDWDPVDVNTEAGEVQTKPELKEAPKPKPEAITSQFSSAIADLNRVLDRLHRIVSSPNYPHNKNQVATLHGSDLDRAISELQTLADALN